MTKEEILQYYTVSPNGDIFSLRKNRLLPHIDNGKGYKKVKLFIGKSIDYYVHRLVALIYIENVDNKKEINHKDGNKANNHIDNLEWCTRKENCQHAFKNGLGNCISANTACSKAITNGELNFISIGEAARHYHISPSSLAYSIRNNNKKLGFTWEYLK